MTQLQYLLPEIFIFLATCISLFLRRKELFALLTFILATAVTIYTYSSTPDGINILNNFVFVSHYTSSIKIVILTFSAIFIVKLIAVRNEVNSQLSTLMLFSTIGMMLTVSSATLLSLYLAIELQSLPLYAMIAINKHSIKSSEAGIKYFIIGSITSAIMVFGISLVFISTGDIHFARIFSNVNNVSLIGLIFITAGLLFKLGIFPFHSWVPDVYEGSLTIVGSYFATISKISIVALLVVIVSGYFKIIPEYKVSSVPFDFAIRRPLLLLGVISTFVGALCAIKQTNIKRLIAYSSILHAGYVLLAASVSHEISIKNPAIIYIIIYSMINFGIFAFILMIKNYNIKTLSGLRKSNPIIALSFTALLLSSAGIPPFAGFFIKLYVIKELLEANLLITSTLALLAGIIAAFYYLRIVKIMYFDDSKQNEYAIKENILLKCILILSGIMNTLIFVYVIKA